jgi:hypothetical protein
MLHRKFSRVLLTFRRNVPSSYIGPEENQANNRREEKRREEKRGEYRREERRGVH